MLLALTLAVSLALPSGARVIETAAIPHHKRLLVLWMTNATVQESPIEPDELYTCPDETQGSRYVTGNLALSLVDPATSRIINTVRTDRETLEPADDERITLPLRIRRGLYFVRALRGEGTPRIMRLRDLNGDGKRYEFAIYESDSCSLTFGTAFGYDEARDEAVWYDLHITTIEEGRIVSEETNHWLDGMYQPPGARGHWMYRRRYPEEFPRHYLYSIHWRPEAGRFEGTVTITAP